MTSVWRVPCLASRAKAPLEPGHGESPTMIHVSDPRVGTLVSGGAKRGDMDKIALAAAAATALSAWQLVPQVTRSLRTRSTAGLSSTWAAIGVVVNLGWLGYRWSQGLWLSLLSPAIATCLYLCLLWLVVRRSRDWHQARIAIAGVALTLLLAGSIGSWRMVGTALAVWAAVQILPAVWSSYRTWGPLAIAPGLWIIGIGQAVLWGYYGYAANDSALVLYGVTMGIGSALILGRVFTAPAAPRWAEPAPQPAPRSLVPAGHWATALVFRQSI